MTVENIHWLGHDSFRIEAQGKQIYIDPWKLSAKSVKADYVFVTHSHYDHFSKEDINKIKIDSTKIIGPADVAKEVGKNAVSMSPNQEITLDQLKIKAIPAYNIGKQFHPKEKNWVGFIITLSDGNSIYHAGDTDFIPEMKSLKVDIALLPVSGTYVMTADEAIEAANTFQPKIAIPMHYGEIVGNKNDAEKFKAGFKGETVIKTVEK
jgi:L-ascorbate metabolism protein UlaG (beta-lactamase superfamily)